MAVPQHRHRLLALQTLEAQHLTMLQPVKLTEALWPLLEQRVDLLLGGSLRIMQNAQEEARRAESLNKSTPGQFLITSEQLRNVSYAKRMSRQLTFLAATGAGAGAFFLGACNREDGGERGPRLVYNLTHVNRPTIAS